MADWQTGLPTHPFLPFRAFRAFLPFLTFLTFLTSITCQDGLGEQGECVPGHPASSDGFMWRGSQGECTPRPHQRNRWTV